MGKVGKRRITRGLVTSLGFILNATQDALNKETSGLCCERITLVGKGL